MIDKDRLKTILVKYKEEFASTWWKDEKYKWKAVKTFNKYWNEDADDFATMLSNSLARTHNLLGSFHYYPREMIKELAAVAPEEVRSMFKALYDESRDVVERILEFKDNAAQLKEKYKPDARQHYQTENAISTYLWLRFPDKYYIYKVGEVQNVAKQLCSDYKFTKRTFSDNLRNFYSLYDEICEFLHSDKELINIFQQQLDEDCYPDPEYKTLTIDVGFYISRKFGTKHDLPISPNKEQEEMPSYVSEESVKTEGRRYWWLFANPKYWSCSEFPVGQVIDYTLYNESGHKRRVFQNFLDAKAGDLAIGYEASPTKKIVALLEIAKEQDGQRIWFKKVENLTSPIDYAVLKDCPELKDMEPFANPTGSLFRLTKDEYDFIIDLIREENPLVTTISKKYTKEDFLSEVFMSEAEYDKVVAVLKNKKNLILQGAPGVGKTFAAKRLAYSIMGECNDSRIEFVQFHQSYSYEDFMLGYKPSESGFELRQGIFYTFCLKAANEPEKDFFFIIDEINRGNMSKIFGELLMLIEKDYRGKKTTLAYDGRQFSVPVNLHIIGMMNTADRSLAMIDYALRRRFSFYEMAPAFDSDSFKKYKENLGNEKFNLLIEKVKELNHAITNDNALGKGFCIGHSYFCNWEKDECTVEKMRQVVDFDILPMLEEYWFDDASKVERWQSALRAILE